MVKILPLAIILFIFIFFILREREKEEKEVEEEEESKSNPISSACRCTSELKGERNPSVSQINEEFHTDTIDFHLLKVPSSF